MQRVARAVLVVVLVACGDATPDGAPPAPNAPGVATPAASPRAEASPELAVVPVSDWTPSAALLARAAALADPGGRDALIEEIDALPAAERVAVWRAGLRLADPVAAQVCASMCSWKWLDAAECDRVVALLSDATLAPGPTSPEVTFHRHAFFEAASAENLHDVLAMIARTDDARVNGSEVSTLHKVAGAGHLPTIAALAAARPGLGDGFRELLWIPCQYTDRHREDVARAVLRDAEPDTPLPGDGLPPLLASVLRRLFVEGSPDKERLGAWALRWLRDATPSDRDADLLVELARRLPDSAEPVWAMRHLRDDGTLAHLHALAPAGTGTDEPDDRARWDATAGAALAVRGDAAALERLAATAAAEADTTVDREALAFLFAVDPARAAALVTSHLVGSDDAIAASTLDRLVQARDDVRAQFGVRFDLASLAGLEEAALASSVSGERLADLGAALAPCRTRRLAEESVRRLAASKALTPWASDRSDPDAALAFLETGAPASFRALLRAWAGGEDGAVRKLALRTLLGVGDPLAGAALVAWFRSGTSELGGGTVDSYYRGEPGLIELPRSPSPEVTAYLRALAEGRETLADTPPETALQGLAVLAGFPESVQIFEALDENEAPPADAVHAEAVRLILEGEPFDAFAAVLRARPDHAFWNEGDVRDPRVTEHLRRLRDRREVGQYAWATGELAVQGDAPARAAHWAVLRRGVYRWVEEAGGRQMTLGCDFTTIPEWLEHLETNCCHERTVQLFVFEHLFGFDPSTEKGVGDTHAGEIRRWWDENGPRFVRSRVLGRFVPEPR